ncbi:MAG: insulinase family protein [Ignavibacteriae bacterium]|nr:insulinase family protein [Ignavibacteriota bacterium]
MVNRKIKPAPKGKIAFNLPQIQTFTLSNFSKVYFVKKETLPIVQINISIPAGSIFEASNKNGMATLTSMLVDEDAGKLNGFQISDKIEVLGSILNINSNKEFTTFSLLSLKENLEKSLDILSLIILLPNFKESDFEREINRLKTQIIQLNDDPSYIASMELQKIIYHSTPYMFPTQGTKQSLDAILNDDIKNFYKKNYLPSDSFFSVVGNIESDEINSLLEKHFCKWKNNPTKKKKFNNTISTGKQFVFLSKQDAAQSEIRIGHISKGRNSDDFFARSVLNSILGGQFSSRININLREDKGYTYGAHSSYNYNQLGSLFSVSTSVKTENTTDAITEILSELQKIKSTITIDEIDFAKSYLIRRYPSLFETYTQVATNLSFLPIYNLDNNYFSDYIKNLSKVTMEDITLAANSCIDLDNLVIVVVGNGSIIKDSLKILAEERDFIFSEFIL